jgi:hypothetical protein
MPGSKQGLVFISCGQFTPEEINLGQDLAAAVAELTEFEGYFAQNQSTLEGLSQHILGALNRCCGFVAVMHQRGTVQTVHGEHVRGSVWVEQEIAIAAFLQQAQKRNLAVAVYLKKGIKREGIRDQLLLGGVEFESEAEVLKDLKTKIANGTFKPVRLPPPKDVEVELGYKTLSSLGVHRYRLDLVVCNIGSEPLTEYWVDLLFPKAVLDTPTVHGALKVRDTATHILIRANRDTVGIDIYPGDKIQPIILEYRMDGQLYHDGSVRSKR